MDSFPKEWCLPGWTMMLTVVITRRTPFNFKHHELTSLGLYINGEPLQGKPLETKFSQDGGQHYVQVYLNLFYGSNIFGHDHGNYISRADFPNEYSLFAFDLTPDLSDGGGHLSLLNRGNLKLEHSFAKALPRTVIVMVYA